jgi:hypothetical protein
MSHVDASNGGHPPAPCPYHLLVPPATAVTSGTTQSPAGGGQGAGGCPPFDASTRVCAL